jgi:hypothetical protein
MTFSGSTLYDAEPGTSAGTIFTSATGAQVRQILAVNADTAEHTVTLTLVRKGGSAADAYSEAIAQAVSVPASSVTEVLTPQLFTALGYLRMAEGDFLYGQCSSSEVTLLIYGSGS